MEGDEQKWSGERAAGTICIQLLWCNKEVCYEHVTLLASIMLLACAALIGGDLSSQSSYVNAKWIIKPYTCTGLIARFLLSASQSSLTVYSYTYHTT